MATEEEFICMADQDMGILAQPLGVQIKLCKMRDRMVADRKSQVTEKQPAQIGNQSGMQGVTILPIIIIYVIYMQLPPYKVSCAIAFVDCKIQSICA